jgi:hypothetical protein
MDRNSIHQSRRGLVGILGAASSVAACCCGGVSRALGQQTGRAIPGSAKTNKSKMLAMGPDVLQNHSPINAINMYLNGFHFYADDMGRQIEAHHYFHHVKEDFFQCVIYDGDQPDSRLIGIEYIVSEMIFQTLSDDEKPLWRSHRHETTSGELVMPGISIPVERTAIATLVNTYGKTWHTWQIDKDAALPLGISQLMMVFTQDGQLDAARIKQRDKELGVATSKERANRVDLAASAGPVSPGANGWQSGQAPQLVLSKLPLKGRRG